MNNIFLVLLSVICIKNSYSQAEQWYSLVYTNDGNTAKVYVDCELKYAVSFKETFTNGDGLFWQHHRPVIPFWLNGDIDAVS